MEELIAVGIEEIVIVVQKEDLGSFESLFHQPDTPENFNRLPPKAQVYARRVLAMGEKVATLAALAPRRLPTLLLFYYCSYCPGDPRDPGQAGRLRPRAVVCQGARRQRGTAAL